MGKYMKGLYWSTKNNFEFPEKEIISNDKENIGIAFSGGGTRSASLTVGYLRALDEIGVLSKVKYISCVSGGGWAAVPFTYLDETINDSQFYGQYKEPQDLDVEFLREEEEYSLNKACANAEIFELIDNYLFAGDELYSRIIGHIFLKPYNLHHLKKFFTYNEDALQKILQNNRNLTYRDFYCVNRNANRPFLIAGGTILRPHFGRYHFEMTPLYTGSYAYFGSAGSRRRYAIGGGYVQPHIFDSDAPHNSNGSTNPAMAETRLGRDRHIFTLSDILGTTGAAPAEYAERFGLGWVGFPEFKYWNPRDVSKQTNKAKEYDFGDGGILENLGIMPLLLRKVDKIICFINGSTEIEERENDEIKVSSSVKALFKPLRNNYGGSFSKNIVFENKDNSDNDKFQTLVKELFNKKRAGEAVIYKSRYTTVNQRHYGIEKGHQVEVVWVYNSMPKKWYDKLNIDVKAIIEAGRFPHYRTFGENLPRIIDLKIEQTKMLSQMASWIVNENASDF